MIAVRRLVLAAALLSATLAAAGTPGWYGRLPRGMRPPPVPPSNPMTPAKIELGRRLFYDADLSADGTMACAGCHEQRRGFADGNRTRAGVTGEAGRRNVPGLANAAWLRPLTFADPAQTTLERQASVPIMGTHPVEMGMAGRAPEIAARLGRSPCYRQMFAEAFPETQGRIDLENVSKALASFQRTFVSFGSAFDHGKLSADAIAGKSLFARNCAGCHAGPLFTDLDYHRLGPRDDAATDQGLFEKTGRPRDQGRFRTPSLRNVALSAPYWHDGSKPTLEAAIQHHGVRHDPAEIKALTAFLESFSDPDFVSRPSLGLPATACGEPL